MLLIGSRALAIRAPIVLTRDPKDFDFVCTENEFSEWKEKNSFRKIEPIDIPKDGRFCKEYLMVDGIPCEFEIAKDGSSTKMMMDIVQNDPASIKTEFGYVPTLDFLFTLKTSHRYLKNSPFFYKNLADWHRMKAVGAAINPQWKEFLKLREKETYNYSHPKLNVKKTDFFKDDQVNYVYDHDSIHRAVAHLEKPAYTYYMKDGQEVQCDKDKFFALPEDVRLYGVLEESYVLALERSQIPFKGKASPKQSFMMALSKVCTSITSGWFRQFAYEHAFDVIKLYNDSYVERFEEGVKNGTVLPFNINAPNNPYK